MFSGDCECKCVCVCVCVCVWLSPLSLSLSLSDLLQYKVELSLSLVHFVSLQKAEVSSPKKMVGIVHNDFVSHRIKEGCLLQCVHVCVCVCGWVGVIWNVYALWYNWKEKKKYSTCTNVQGYSALIVWTSFILIIQTLQTPVRMHRGCGQLAFGGVVITDQRH